MYDAAYLRDRIRKCEDKKISIEQLSRDVWLVATGIQDGERSSTRQAFVRLSNQLRALVERSFYDDVQDEVRAIIDEVYTELIELD